MKNFSSLKLSILLGCSIFILNLASYQLAHANSYQIGDVKISMLPEKQFQELHGEEWVLMDGKTVLDKDNLLAKVHSWKTVPDARGRFMRMKNHGSGVDKSGESALGALVDFLTAK